jgi:hypothetical protein
MGRFSRQDVQAKWDRLPALVEWLCTLSPLDVWTLKRRPTMKQGKAKAKAKGRRGG